MNERLFIVGLVVAERSEPRCGVDLLSSKAFGAKLPRRERLLLLAAAAAVLLVVLDAVGGFVDRCRLRISPIAERDVTIGDCPIEDG